MDSSEIYNETTQRLKTYKLFSTETIQVVATLAQKQATYKRYQDFFKDTGITDVKLYRTQKGTGVPVVDIPAKAKKAKGTLVVHLPMANSLDPNQLYQVSTIAAAHEAYRVIAFGNPSGKPYAFREQNLNTLKRFQIASRKDLKHLIEPELEYLASQGISDACHVGYSYGALKALLHCYFEKPENVRSMLLIDPVAHPRYLNQLLGDFTAAFKPMGEYVNRTKIQTYLDARQDAVKLVNYSKGLMRPINIAVGYALARIDFIELLEKVLKKQPDIVATVAWGSKSEVGNDAHMTVSLQRLSNKNSIRPMRLDGDTHSFANDIHLYAAIVRESLAKL